MKKGPGGGGADFFDKLVLFLFVCVFLTASHSPAAAGILGR